MMQFISENHIIFAKKLKQWEKETKEQKEEKSLEVAMVQAAREKEKKLTRKKKQTLNSDQILDDIKGTIFLGGSFYNFLQL